MQPWIQHISLRDLRNGYHYDPGDSGILISIRDPGTEQGIALFNFAHRFDFEFEDYQPGQGGTNLITRPQAKKIADVLHTAKSAGSNVIVNCFAGLCRSGGVAQAAESIGFRIANEYGPFSQPTPNEYVKLLIMIELDTDAAPEHSALADPWSGRL